MILLCSFATPLASLDPRHEERLARIAGQHYYGSHPFVGEWPPESWGDSDWSLHSTGRWAERMRPQSWARVSHRALRLEGVRGSLADLVDMHAVREMVESGELIVRSLTTEAPGLHLDEDAHGGVLRCYQAAARAGLATPPPRVNEGQPEYECDGLPAPSPMTRPALLAAWIAVHTSPTPQTAEVDVIHWLRAPRRRIRTTLPAIPTLPGCRWPAPLWAGGAA